MKQVGSLGNQLRCKFQATLTSTRRVAIFIPICTTLNIQPIYLQRHTCRVLFRKLFQAVDEEIEVLLHVSEFSLFVFQHTALFSQVIHTLPNLICKRVIGFDHRTFLDIDAVHSRSKVTGCQSIADVHFKVTNGKVTVCNGFF